MYEKDSNKFNWHSLIIGIFMVLVALYSFKTPISNLAAIVMVFSISAILKGILQLIGRIKIRQFTNYKSTTLIFLGIANILIGIFLLINMQASIIALPTVFSIWFLIESIGELIMAGQLREVSTSHFWLVVVASVINIGLSLFLLTNPAIAAFTLSLMVGTYFLVAGITYIVRAF